jgi:hypothetical protein
LKIEQKGGLTGLPVSQPIPSWRVSFPRNFVCQGRPKTVVTFGRQEMKIQKQAYTAEIKELAVKRVKDGQRVSEVSFDGVDRLLPGEAG